MKKDMGEKNKKGWFMWPQLLLKRKDEEKSGWEKCETTEMGFIKLAILYLKFDVPHKHKTRTFKLN